MENEDIFEFDGEDIENLTQLGLTSSQAKIYLALLSLERANGRTISTHAKVARQEAYRLLSELEAKGLVERKIGTPTEFRSIAPEIWVPNLIQEKKKKILEMQKRSAKLMNLPMKKKSITLEDESPELSLVSGREANINKMIQAIRTAKQSIDIITTSKRASFLVPLLWDEIKNSINKEIKIQLLINKTEKNDLPIRNLREVENKPFFSLKYITAEPATAFWVVDKKQVKITTNPDRDFGDATSLWSEISTLATIFSRYFETTWNKAI